MSDIVFYASPRAGLRALLPRLLDACLERGWRALVQTASPEESAQWDEWLWTYAPNSFLPHGLADAPHADEQPVCISHQAARPPNKAEVVFLLEGAHRTDGDKFRRQVYVWEDAGAPEPRAAMEAAWRAHQAAGASCIWWERVSGKWQQRPPSAESTPSASAPAEDRMPAADSMKEAE